MMPIEFRPAMPGARPSDHPGWRLAFEIWDCLRHDGWAPVCRLLLLMTPAVALVAAALILQSWSLAAFLTAGAGTLAVSRRLSTRHQPDNRQTAGNPPGIGAWPNEENNGPPHEAGG
jgi:hypothetical protein